MIVGLTGKNAAGKGEVVRFLQSRSFRAHSLSDEVRRDLDETGDPPARETMIARGRALRAEFGPGVLAERIRDHLDNSSHHVVDSIRHPAEVGALRRGRDFLLLGIVASPEIRYARLRARARPGDPESMEAFLQVEACESGGADSGAQQLDRCLELADHLIPNEGTIEELEAAVLRVVKSAIQGAARPSWDRYFMDIAQVVARRSNCVKRKVAAVIVKDRRIISTGYNGTPRGVRNCNEGGCPRCAELAPAGSSLGECLCSHGEENAITQAAYHGVSLIGATLYSTYSPCLICAKMITNSGIREVVYRDEYPLAGAASGLLAEAGIASRRLHDGE